jgi:predicted DNA-binding transcriptional regulator YafY
VEIGYDSYFDKREISTRLHPYRLVFISRAWYVIGYSAMHDMVRTFKLDRIITLHWTDESFEPDADFSLENYFGNAWSMIRGDRRYKVAIRFSPKVAGNVEEVFWHATQQIDHLEDGSIRYEVEVDGVHEIAWWVLGYGKEAVVEEPPELQQIIRGHIAEMAAAYGGL